MASGVGSSLVAAIVLQSMVASCGRMNALPACTSPCDQITASGALSAKPSAIAFGDVYVGSTASLNVALAGTGTGSVTITQLNVTGSGFSGSGLPVPVTLAPGESRSVAVTFAPQATGSLIGEVSIATNAPGPPMRIVPTGRGVPAPPSPPPPPPVPGVVTAFPGAQGGGALSVGGRGGTAYQVTNLNDSGAGSLRACVDASGPRTCLFRTGGTNTLATRLTFRNPPITLSSQT